MSEIILLVDGAKHHCQESFLDSPGSGETRDGPSRSHDEI